MLKPALTHAHISHSYCFGAGARYVWFPLRRSKIFCIETIFRATQHIFTEKMSHIWVIILFLIALSSKTIAKSVQFASVDPFDEKCDSLAATNYNWNFQIPGNSSYLPSNYNRIESDVVKEEDAQWLNETWEATKSNASWGTLQPGITLFKGFALSSDSDYSWVLLMQEDGDVRSIRLPDTPLTELCSMAMNMADKCIVSLDSFDAMFKPIDQILAQEIRARAWDGYSLFLSFLIWMGIAIAICVIISIIGCIFCYHF
ncbi:Hypothetical predicted protein [Cloeon dipterum]|uniref:Uncharacterized protein n=1 Tax=Cloeon dipterum TaxID=197152 RepID=A0A8S1DVA1_9INSE|nr:Hypothetical predicted protein [Cloeon dipterum]